jgi:hypothetical protein
VAEDARARRRLAKALAGSLLIYALPLVGPHAVWLVGEYLFADVSRAPGHKPRAWIALDFAVRPGRTRSTGAAPRVGARPPRRRALRPPRGAPIFFLALEWTYLSALPSYFLIETDVAREWSEWPTECFLPGVSLATVRSPPDLPLERAARAWATESSGRSYALLEACSTTTNLELDAAPLTVPFVLADGRALFDVWDRVAGHLTLVVRAGRRRLRRLGRLPRGRPVPPALARDRR